MAELNDTSMSESTFTFIPAESCDQEATYPTPTPRTPRQDGEGPLVSGDQLLFQDQLYEEQVRACSYDDYAQVLKLCDDKDRKDITTLQNLPQMMKETLFFQNEDMLQSSQDRVKAKSANDEEYKKFLKYLKTVSNHQNPNLKEKVTKQLEILNHAAIIATNGDTSLKSSNFIFEKVSQVFKEASAFTGDQVEVSSLPLDLLREASDNNKQRQQHLQGGNLDAAEDCLKKAMENIEVSVARAEIQKQEAERRYTEVACTNRHIVIQSMEREIAEALSTESNGINLLQSHCSADQLRIERATNTLEEVYSRSKQHSGQLDELQIAELAKNKKEQEELDGRLKKLRESAKKIDTQRNHARKQDKLADKAYKESKGRVGDWGEQIARLQTQTQHASSVLNLVHQSSQVVMEDFYKAHQLYLSELNTMAVESLQLYRQCLVGRIVACRFRNQELETNISSLRYIIDPRKEELKQQRKTGLKVMAEKTEREVGELSTYKHTYMVAKQSIDAVLEEAFEKLEAVDAAIMKKVPDARLQHVDAVYELEREQRDAAWDNLEMQSLTKAYFC